MSNKAGQAYALMVMTPIVPGQEGALKAYLEGLSQQDSPLTRLSGVHFGRWLILERFHPEDSQPKKESLSCQYLIFTTCSDGPVDAYLDELCKMLAPEAAEIWGRCVGCPEGAAGADLKHYLLHNQIDTGLFVAAYPKATVPKVKAALDVRERMIDFAVSSQGMGPDELQSAFDEEFR